MRVAETYGHHLTITELSGCFVFGLDIGHLVQKPFLNKLVERRLADDWLSRIISSLQEPDSHGFAHPRWAESAYSYTDRALRNTFARRHARRLLPIVFFVEREKRYVEKSISFFVERISLSPQGGLAARIVFEKDNTPLSAKETIELCGHVRRRAYDVLVEPMSNFCAWWNKFRPEEILSLPTIELFEEALYAYEILDMDFTAGDLPLDSIKSLLFKKNEIAACELAAISRMSPTSVAVLRDTKIREFANSDLGARDDELWTVNRERMVRRHPDRKQPHNKAFFEDVKTATEILVLQQSTFDFLEEWMAARRSEIFTHMFSDEGKAGGAQVIYSQLESITRVGRLLVEPLMLQNSAKHSFYIKLISRLSACLDLEERNKRASQAMRDFASLADSASGFSVGLVSAQMASAQVQLAASARKISLATAWLTILAILLAAMQIYIPLMENKPVAGAERTGSAQTDHH